MATQLNWHWYLSESVSEDLQWSIEDSRFRMIYTEDLIITKVY